MKQKKILCLFDYVARTGFGTVSKNIVKEVKKHYGDNIKLDILAINYFGPPYNEGEDYIISARLNDAQDDSYGRYFFLKTLQDSDDYDGIFIIQDIGVIVPFIEILQHIKAEKKEKNKKSFKSIFYFPVDCELVYELTRNLEFFDVLVTYTEYARKEILRHKPDLRTKLKVLPHGNNSKEYFPIESKTEIAEFRKSYFGENSDKFIITNINRNQPRKDIPNSIFSFIEAKKEWNPNIPKPFLYLHCHPKDPMGWDLRGIMLQTDLKEDIDYKLLPKEFEEQMMETEEVNKIYNASDVYLTTTLGEGWGLGYSEAAACRIPIVAPYSTSFIEMSNYGKNAYMCENLYPYCHTIDNVIRLQTDIYEVADNLKYVAEVKSGLHDGALEQMETRIENNYKWVKKLEWAEICKSWVEYFKIY